MDPSIETEESRAERVALVARACDERRKKKEAADKTKKTIMYAVAYSCIVIFAIVASIVVTVGLTRS